jgi:hypothetical protein
MFDPRLIKAELLKLGRRPGMLTISLLLTVGLIVVAFAVTAIQHGSNPEKYDPAGGLAGYTDAIGVIGLMALIVGVIIGATGGTQDVESGVFRDLVATGRSRLALFGARMTGALVMVSAIVALTAAATAAAALLLADGTPTPEARDIVSGTASLLAAGAVSSAMAVGLSALVGSRGPVIGILLGFLLAAQPLLLEMGFLGAARELVPLNAVSQIGELDPVVQSSLGTAIGAIVGWSVISLAAGAWRTRTREI